MLLKNGHLKFLLECQDKNLCVYDNIEDTLASNFDRYHEVEIWQFYEFVYILCLFASNLFSLVIFLGQYGKLYSLKTLRVYVNKIVYYVQKYFMPCVLLGLLVNVSYVGLTSLYVNSSEYWWDTRALIKAYFAFVSEVPAGYTEGQINVMDLMIFALIIIYIRLIIFSVLISEIQYDMKISIANFNEQLLSNNLTLNVEDSKQMTFTYFLEIFFLHDWKCIETNLSDQFVTVKQLDKNITNLTYFKSLLNQIKKNYSLELGEDYLENFKVLTKDAYDELETVNKIKTKLFSSLKFFEISMLVHKVRLHDRTDLKSLDQINNRYKKNCKDYDDFLQINYNTEDIISDSSKIRFFHGDKFIEVLFEKLIKYYNQFRKESIDIIANKTIINESIQNQDLGLRKYMKRFRKLNEEINELEAEDLWLDRLEKLKEQPFIHEMGKQYKVKNLMISKLSND